MSGSEELLNGMTTEQRAEGQAAWDEEDTPGEGAATPTPETEEVETGAGGEVQPDGKPTADTTETPAPAAPAAPEATPAAVTPAAPAAPAPAPYTALEPLVLDAGAIMERLKDFKVPNPAGGEELVGLKEAAEGSPGFLETILKVTEAALQMQEERLAPFLSFAQSSLAERQNAAVAEAIERGDPSLGLEGIPEAGELLKNPEFWDWFDKADPRLQQLAMVNEPVGLAQAMGLYLKQTGKSAAVRVAAAQRKITDSRNALHQGTLRQRPGQDRRAAAKTPEEERREAWEHDDGELEGL